MAKAAAGPEEHFDTPSPFFLLRNRGCGFVKRKRIYIYVYVEREISRWPFLKGSRLGIVF